MNQLVRKRRNFTKDYKIKVLREIEGGRTLTQVAREHEVHASVICRWQRDYLKDSQDAFTKKKKQKDATAKAAELERIIGRLHIENDILKQAMTLLEENLHQYRKRKNETQ